MEVNQAAPTTTAPARPLAPGTTASAEETRQTFLQLLVAQMEHQDPLKPMENTEFTAQLAQFSVLEQIEAMNTNFGALLSNQEAANRTQAVDFIGKTVDAVGDTTTVQDGEAPPLRYTLSADSAQVLIHIIDAAGAVRRTITAGQQSAGQHTVPWHGLDELGQTLPDGTYRFTVTATDAAGSPVDAETLTQGVVEGVEYVDDQVYLVVGGSRVDLSSVLSVHTLHEEEGS
jgi:flagellar basal-body rod modification protein FlgD